MKYFILSFCVGVINSHIHAKLQLDTIMSLAARLEKHGETISSLFTTEL